MQTMRFSIEIRSPEETVWKTPWEEKTFRDWGSIIDAGMYLTGDLKEGNEVQFISPSGTAAAIFCILKYLRAGTLMLCKSPPRLIAESLLLFHFSIWKY